MKGSHKHLQLKYSTNFEETDVVTIALSNNGKVYSSQSLTVFVVIITIKCIVLILCILYQICVLSVDFWESEFEEDLLKLLHKEKQYPPRLEMTSDSVGHL